MRQGTITACASDNVRDPFYAYGDLDAFEVFLAALRIGHLDDDLPSAVSVVTSAPATLMGIDSHAGRIAPGMPALCRLCRDVLLRLAQPADSGARTHRALSTVACLNDRVVCSHRASVITGSIHLLLFLSQPSHRVF